MTPLNKINSKPATGSMRRSWNTGSTLQLQVEAYYTARIDKKNAPARYSNRSSRANPKGRTRVAQETEKVLREMPKWH